MENKVTTEKYTFEYMYDLERKGLKTYYLNYKERSTLARIEWRHLDLYHELIREGKVDKPLELNELYRPNPVKDDNTKKENKEQYQDEIRVVKIENTQKFILDVECSVYRNHLDRTGAVMTISDWINSKYCINAQRRYDNAKTDEERKDIKSGLAAITPFGKFSSRKADGLIVATGLMQFDIDAKDQKGGFVAEQCRDTLGSQNWCVFASLSISKRGVWGLVRTDGNVKMTFKRLKQAIDKLGYVLDSAPSSEVSLRYACYDDNHILNNNVICLPAFRPKRKPKKVLLNPTDEVARLIKLCDYLDKSGANILEEYSDWMTAAAALASLGENGRHIFHRLSERSSKYDYKKTDMKFDNFLKNASGRVTIASIYHIAKQHGLSLSEIK